MSGASLSLATVGAGALALALAAAWLLVWRYRGTEERFGSVASGSERNRDADESVARPFADPDAKGAGGRRDDPPPLDADGETTVCRHCGAWNRAEYRYCRWCARPGVVDGEDGPPAGAGVTGRSL